jgi:malonyl-CoA O-methyltransferase
MTLNRKEKIEFNFDKNTQTYEDNAPIQHKVSQHLCDIISVSQPPSNILEIGCGTGFLTKKLIQKFPNAHITAIDISSKMVVHCQNKFTKNPRINFLKMDGENLKFNQKFDLITSNMSIQWFSNSIHSIEEIKKYLSKNGQLYYSTIGQNNFQEWQDTLDKLSLPNGLISVPEYKEIFKEEFLIEKHISANEFLKSLKNVRKLTG